MTTSTLYALVSLLIFTLVSPTGCSTLEEAGGEQIAPTYDVGDELGLWTSFDGIGGISGGGVGGMNGVCSPDRYTDRIPLMG